MPALCQYINTMTTGETLRVAYAVGSDGMQSVVREAAGIGFTGSSYAEPLVPADVVMDWKPGPTEVSLTFGSAGLLVIAPLPGGQGHYRIVATVDQAPESPSLTFVQCLLDERAPGQAAVTEVAWSSRFRVHHRVARPLPGRPAIPGRRCRPRTQPRRRPGHEHRPPGRLRPGQGFRHRHPGRLQSPPPARSPNAWSPSPTG